MRCEGMYVNYPFLFYTVIRDMQIVLIKTRVPSVYAKRPIVIARKKMLYCYSGAAIMFVGKMLYSQKCQIFEA